MKPARQRHQAVANPLGQQILAFAQRKPNSEIKQNSTMAGTDPGLTL
jgi:hypothetical protein